MKTVLVVLVVLVAVGAWFLLAGPGGGEEGEGIERSISDAPSEELVSLRGRRDAEDPGALDAREQTTTDASEGRAAEPLFSLHGRVLGLDSTREGAALVRVLPVESGWVATDWKIVDGVVGDGGTFELDVTDLMAYTGDLTHLEVWVDHPAYVQARVRADVAAARAAGRGTLSVELTLHLGIAVTGEVRTETGEPIPDADVAMFVGPSPPSGVGAALLESADASDRTDAEGRYRLRVAKHGTYRVVAATDERLPDGERIVLRQGSEALVRPLVLRPSATIAGRVVFRETGVADVWIRATPEGHDDLASMTVGRRAIGWTADGLVPATQWVQSDADGGFRFVGLAPGPHTVDPSRAHSETLPHITSLAGEALQQQVHAPADDVVLAISGAVLEVRVTAADQPLADATVEIDAGGRGLFVDTAADGTVRFLVAPASECTVRVEKQGFESAARELVASAAGRTEVVDVPLQPAAPAPVLLVSFTGPHATSVKQAMFQLDDVSETGREADERFVRDEGGGGTYRLDRIAPGTCRLTVRPGEGMFGAFGYFLAEVREVVIPAEGELRLELPLRLGGRLRIAARDGEGALLEAACVIRDASGGELEVDFTAQGETMATTSTGVLDTLSPSVVGPPLPAGSYTIELEAEGHRKQTVVAEVTTSETTDVDVRLTDR